MRRPAVCSRLVPSLTLLVAGFPATVLGAQEDAELQGPSFFLAPWVGMCMSTAPSETSQAFGVRILGRWDGGLALEGELSGHYNGSEHRTTALAADIRYGIRGEGGGLGLSGVVGARHWYQRNAWSAGLRVAGGANPETWSEGDGDASPQIQFWLELRGGITTGGESAGRPSRGFGMASVSLVLPILLGS